MEQVVYTYGGNGVAITIRRPDHPGVFYGMPERFGFVLVEDEDGDFRTEDGQHVAIVAIRKDGTIQWTVPQWDPFQPQVAKGLGVSPKDPDFVW